MNAAKPTNIAQELGKSIKELAGNMKTTIFTADLLLSGLSGMVYVCLRLIFHEMIKAAGVRDVGSLDQEPLLFNLYASVLRFFHPLYESNSFSSLVCFV